MKYRRNEGRYSLVKRCEGFETIVDQGTYGRMLEVAEDIKSEHIKVEYKLYGNHQYQDLFTLNVKGVLNEYKDQHAGNREC